MDISVFDHKVITPFKYLGLTSKFWEVHIDTLIYTWLAILFLITVVVIGRIFLKKKLNVISLLVEQSVEFFIDLCKESLGGVFRYQHFAFVLAIFLFTFFCSIIGLLPFVEEATKDLNTAFAVALSSFLFVQWNKIKFNGIGSYLKDFTQPFFLLLPLNLVGEFAKIASMSFRLFGNILGGAVIFCILLEALEKYKTAFIILTITCFFVAIFLERFIDLKKYPLTKMIVYFLMGITFTISWIQMFFGIFEGFIQAFVIAMLTIIYLAVGIHHEEEGEKTC